MDRISRLWRKDYGETMNLPVFISTGALVTWMLGTWLLRKKASFSNWSVTIRAEQMGRRTDKHLRRLGVKSLFIQDLNFNLLVPAAQFTPRIGPFMISFRPSDVPATEVKYRDVANRILEAYPDSKAIVVTRSRPTQADYNYGREFNVTVLDFSELPLFCQALLYRLRGDSTLPDGLSLAVTRLMEI